MIDKNKEFTCSMDLRVKPEDDRRGESGRSMVEMLGTLAIIGVLSVGSIAGYRYAMDNYYTNEILAGASQRAVLVAAQIASGREASLKEFDKIETAGGEFDDRKVIDVVDGFGIRVTKVKETVCQNIIKALANTNTFIAKDDDSKTLNNMFEKDCSGDSNSLLFVYTSDLGQFEPECESDTDCISGQACQDGQCVCKNGGVVAIDGRSNEFAHIKMCCYPEMVINGYCCRTIIENDDGTKSCCMASDSMCCPSGSFWSGYDNTCHPCDEEGPIRMLNANGSSACRFCPNRVALADFCRTECPNPEMILVDRYCTCPLEKPYLNTTTNECFSLEALTINKKYAVNNKHKVVQNGEWVFDASQENICYFLKDNPHYRCLGGYVMKCDDLSIAPSSDCQTCDQVDLTTIKFQSQCEFCSGTWDGENWFTGTCQP